jgi:hypothetical protein
MAGSGRVVIGGVDTPGSAHHAAAIDVAGRVLATAQFEATAVVTADFTRGYAATVSYRRSEWRVPAATGRDLPATCPHKATVTTAPAPLRERLEILSSPQRIEVCAAMRAGQTRLDDPVQGTEAALRSLSRRGSAGEPCAVQGCDRAPGA